MDASLIGAFFKPLILETTGFRRVGMIIVVGSTNELKLKAVEKCFKAFFKEVIVEGVSVRVPPQPVGFKETLRGALLRAKAALGSGGDYGVGLEAGLIKIPHSISGYVDQHICAIADRDEKVTLGFSMAFEFPICVVEKIISGEAGEAEEVMEEISGIDHIGDKYGAIGYLTRRLIDRVNLCEQAVISALIPRINPSLYRARWPRLGEILEELG